MPFLWLIGAALGGFLCWRQMGSSSSKEAASSSSDGVRGTRSKRARFLQSACLAGFSGSPSHNEQVSCPQNKENDKLESEQCTDQIGTESGLVKCKCRGKVRVLRRSQVPSISSSVDLGEQFEQSVAHVDSGTASSSTHIAVARSQNSLSQSRSCFNFIPENISFRLSRALSMGSSGADSVFSTRLPISNAEEGFPTLGDGNSLNERIETHQIRDLLPAAHAPALLSTNLSSPSRYRDSSLGTLQVAPTASGSRVHMQNDDIVSLEEVSGSNTNGRTVAAANRYSQRDHMETDNTETRCSDWRTAAQEPVEESVRFSRTLSVGRLRDRVLCRTSFSDGLLGHVQDDRPVGDNRQGNRRRFWGSVTRMTSSDGIPDIQTTSASYHLPSASTSTSSSEDYEVETPQPRETSNHALVEHRTAFLERRRRIRSQVRALQRLGSRFENLSGHDRSCILSGQHRSGRCMCRTNSRAANPDDTSTRSSISRIVMLAEALFEVLDEIHQQSVVLSSRPSLSLIGSVPAPKEVVERMPVKIYSKPQKHQNEEAPQCYICLVEYEDGDCMRILPCRHDFHRTCIDKWLKEIHRVCPLCRGDVCRSGLSSLEKVK